MSYLALARKYRPQSFESLLGQQRVLSTLTHGIDNDRIHHAYLFSGTRGVGKTSVARIIAKALNCEKGPTSKPCLTCNSCVAIQEGSFIDLVEIDAASRTGVDDTRELLEQTHYRPSQGRYRVYLIDEVHMFSKSSFNALLKTLEEPPKHIVFLLATTNVEKIPVTILSRCLQFHLKLIDEATITKQLQIILEAEKISYEAQALETIATQADGSMRDGISLLDQAISFCNGEVKADLTLQMLGSLSELKVLEVLIHLTQGRLDKALELSNLAYENGLDFEKVFDEMIKWCQRVAQVQALKTSGYELSTKDFQALGGKSAKEFEKLCQVLNPQTAHLWFDVLCRSKQNLKLAPHSKIAFDMALIRLHHFKPMANDEIKQALKPSQKTEPTGGHKDDAI